MNKLLLTRDGKKQEMDSSLILEDNTVIINETTFLFIDARDSQENLTLVIAPEVELQLSILGFQSANHFSFLLKKDARVSVSHFGIDSCDSYQVVLQEEGAKIRYCYSSLTRNSAVIPIEIKHMAQHTESEISNHCFQVAGDYTFDVTGIVLKDCAGCICNQENQIINLTHGKSKIHPNLLIDHYDVVANHSAYVGKFSKDVLFYLASRGLNPKESYVLLLTGFLLGEMSLSDELKGRFENKIQEYGGERNESGGFSNFTA